MFKGRFRSRMGCDWWRAFSLTYSDTTRFVFTVESTATALIGESMVGTASRSAQPRDRIPRQDTLLGTNQ
jgi:hypothetical protein